jgi:hypothetical protein
MNTKLPNQPDDDAPDPFEALLKEPAPYIEDDGFTTGVIAVLPKRQTSFLRKIVLVGASGVGFVLAALWLPWQQLGEAWSVQQTPQDTGSYGAWFAVLTVLASLAWTATNALSDEH